jgi:hypothetical protein
VVASAATDEAGQYRFETLAPGDYFLRFDLPAGYAFSPQFQSPDADLDSDPDPANGQTALFSLAASQNDGSRDAGLYPLASVGDRIWHDLDADGVQEAGEPGVAGVTVELYSAEGNWIAAVASDAQGLYGFGDLEPGDYFLIFSLPDGFYFSGQNLSPDFGLDSDPDPASGQTAIFSLAAGQQESSQDAGMYQLAALGNFVWKDRNANGIQDQKELGVRAVTVSLYNVEGNLVASTTSNKQGQYAFGYLIPGSYYLVFSLPAGYAFSPQQQGLDASLDSDPDPATGRTGVFSLISSQHDTNWDAGLLKNKHSYTSVVNLVWDD